MKKLKKQKIDNLLNYKQFLKNNYLKDKKLKLKNIVFENQILYNNADLESYVIEFNNYENIYLPFTLIKIGEIFTIEKTYENEFLFNYDLNYNILHQFNQIMFKYVLQEKGNLIQGRLLGGNWNNKKIFISILGFIFFMKSFNLNKALKYKKNFYFNKKHKKGFYNRNKINTTKLINCYKLKYLNFQINNLKKVNKKEFSRISYIQKTIQKTIQKKKNKNKSVLSRKIYV
uniref:Ymf99 n=1 Tax=Phytophthora pinifolia TaxID=538568 RepID=UPI002027E949|nr:Ymf99 [Phytophthora pinifolia]DAZ88538.1 TPA_asm: Ymf99 [Phytophthora pinifolia]